MKASVLVPVSPTDPDPAACVRALVKQTIDPQQVEVLLVGYGGRRAADFPNVGREGRIHFLDVAAESPYVARNHAAERARGEVMLFTEPTCEPEPDWVVAHLAKLEATGATVSVGHVAPGDTTPDLELVCAYEQIRDEFVFSGESWRHHFGRPKNMAIARRRFDSHGPFVPAMRGADSEFVQRVARDVSCREVVLARSAVVKQTAIADLRSLWADRFRHNHAMHVCRSSHAAPLSRMDRVRLFDRTLRTHRYGPLETAKLLVLASFGILVFQLGGWSARLSGAAGVDPPSRSAPGRSSRPVDRENS